MLLVGEAQPGPSCVGTTEKKTLDIDPDPYRGEHPCEHPTAFPSLDNTSLHGSYDRWQRECCHVYRQAWR